MDDELWTADRGLWTVDLYTLPPPDLPWLERANRLALIVRQLSTTIHDVNNMLVVIAGYTALLASDPSQTVREFAR